LRNTILAVCLLSLIGCNLGEKLFGLKDGEQGPPGPAGAGTRKVYTGTTTAEPFSVIVPELTLLQKPAIQVLIRKSGDALFYEIPGLYNVNSSTLNPYWSYNASAGVTISFTPAGTDYMVIVIV
jgi:hypothetical protein